jgi:hypothetical protein
MNATHKPMPIASIRSQCPVVNVVEKVLGQELFLTISFFKAARAGERTRDRMIFVYFITTLPLRHSGSPCVDFFFTFSSFPNLSPVLK